MAQWERNLSSKCNEKSWNNRVFGNFLALAHMWNMEKCRIYQCLELSPEKICSFNRFSEVFLPAVEPKIFKSFPGYVGGWSPTHPLFCVRAGGVGPTLLSQIQIQPVPKFPNHESWNDHQVGMFNHPRHIVANRTRGTFTFHPGDLCGLLGFKEKGLPFSPIEVVMGPVVFPSPSPTLSPSYPEGAQQAAEAAYNVEDSLRGSPGHQLSFCGN